MMTNLYAGYDKHVHCSKFRQGTGQSETVTRCPNWEGYHTKPVQTRLKTVQEGYMLTKLGELRCLPDKKHGSQASWSSLLIFGTLCPLPVKSFLSYTG